MRPDALKKGAFAKSGRGTRWVLVDVVAQRPVTAHEALRRVIHALFGGKRCRKHDML